MEASVTGALLLPPEARLTGASVAHVRLVDHGRADTASIVVDEQVSFDLPAALGGGTRLPFALHCPTADPRASYGVQAHVDVNGDGRIGVGDLVSTQSHPVITFGHPTYVEVPVRIVQ